MSNCIDEERLVSRPRPEPQVRMLALGNIQPLDNVRSDLGDVDALAQNIRVRGLLHPVLVRPASRDAEHGREWELIVGYRRLAAVRQLGMDAIPAIVRDATDEELVAEMLSENMQREDHSALDEARVMQRMVDVFGWSRSRVARELGVDRSQVIKRLALLNLPEQVQSMVRDGTITPSHAEVINGLDSEDDQVEMAELTSRLGLSVAKLSSYVGQVKQRQRDEQAAVVAPPAADTPLLTVDAQHVTDLPSLAVRADLDGRERAQALLYVLLRSCNDVEMREHLAEHHDADDNAGLWAWVRGLDEAQCARMTETMVRRWLSAAHRYPTLPDNLRADLGATPASTPFPLIENTLPGAGETLMNPDELEGDMADAADEPWLDWEAR